jgi:hypothetical protein
MRLTRVSVAVTTNSSGAATAYTPALNGVVRSVRYIKPTSGGLDGGADIDIVTDKGAVVVWDKDNLAASTVIYPMIQAQSTAGVDISGFYVPIPVCDERIKITVANGGNALAGTFEFLIEGVAL